MNFRLLFPLFFKERNLPQIKNFGVLSKNNLPEEIIKVPHAVVTYESKFEDQ